MYRMVYFREYIFLHLVSEDIRDNGHPAPYYQLIRYNEGLLYFSYTSNYI
jgi:hypothetical protein